MIALLVTHLLNSFGMKLNTKTELLSMCFRGDFSVIKHFWGNGILAVFSEAARIQNIYWCLTFLRKHFTCEIAVFSKLIVPEVLAIFFNIKPCFLGPGLKMFFKSPLGFVWFSFRICPWYWSSYYVVFCLLWFLWNDTVLVVVIVW